MPSPDSIMQPSITPSPSARAACAIRTASRMPPDFASLMLIPCAISAHARRRPACGSPRRRRSGPASAASAPGPPGSPARSGCSQYSTPSSASCGIASSASSSDHHSLTSTCSGTSVTERTARTRSTSRPSPPPSFSFSRRNAARPARPGAPCRPARRARSSTTSAGPVAEGRAAATRARRAACPGGRAAPRRVPPSRHARRDRREPRADLLERERVVAEQRARAPRRTRVPTPPSRRSARSGAASPQPVAPVVLERDLDDLGLVVRLSRDPERLGELQADDAGLDLHARSLRTRLETTTT